MEVTKSNNFCLYLIVLQIHIFEGDRKIFHHFGKFLKSIKTFTLKAFCHRSAQITRWPLLHLFEICIAILCCKCICKAYRTQEYITYMYIYRIHNFFIELLQTSRALCSRLILKKMPNLDISSNYPCFYFSVAGLSGNERRSE